MVLTTPVKGRLNVRFGSKADMCSAQGHVRFTPESGHHAVSFDQLVDESEELRRHCDPECFGRLEVDDKRKLTRLLDRQVGRLGPLEDLVDIDCGALVHVLIARSVGH